MNASSIMSLSCDIALKEWKIVCDAIRTGKQQLLFRTGGIEELATGFEPKHSQFWLYPTRFHQTSELVTPEFAELIATQNSSSPTLDHDKVIPIDLFCKVSSVHFVSARELLDQLRPWHVLSDDVLDQRFEYRQPGLFVMVIEPYLASTVAQIEVLSQYDGCKSWVELQQSILTEELEPILTPDRFTHLNQRIAEILGESPSGGKKC